MSVAYLDSSAFLKLVFAEPESAALAEWVQAWPQQASSQLLRLEAFRAVRRFRPDLLGELRVLLTGIDLVTVSDDLLETAGSLEPLTLRALDAIHLATALALRNDLGAVVTYDRRMIEAAHQLGLPVASPA
ncbi:MAG: type II toxin-antitoxin system VapC family toxin [Chloroflexota bacterium]